MPKSKSPQYAALVAEGADEFDLPTTYACATPVAASSGFSQLSIKSRSVKPGPLSLEDLEEKEGLISTLIPAPGGRRNRLRKFRVVALAVLVVFVAVLLYLAIVGTGRKTQKDAGLGWTGSRVGEVSWGQANVEAQSGGSWDTMATATATAQEDFYEDYPSTTTSFAAAPTTTGAKLTPPFASINHNTTSFTAGKFSAAQMDAVDQMARNGTLSAYKWHDSLPSLATSSKSYSSTQEKDGGRLIIVGDLHGTHRSLLALLHRLSFAPSHDTLVHTGDVVGKSPLDSSLQTLALLRKLGARGVRGNHDQRVVEWRRWMEALGPLDQSTATTSRDEEEQQSEEMNSSAALEDGQDGFNAPALSNAGAVGGGGFRRPGGGAAGARVPLWLRPGSGAQPERRPRERKRVERGWFSWVTGGSGGADPEQEGVEEAMASEEEWEASPYRDENEGDASSSSEETTSSSTKTATTTATGGGLRRPFGRPADLVPSSSASSSSSTTARPLSSSSFVANTPLLTTLYAHLSPSLSRPQLAELGIRVPEGWEWGGEEFEIARHMTNEDRDYLEGLPLSLWVEEVAGWVVHAGLVPLSNAPSSSSLSTSSALPSLLSSTSPLTFTPSASVLASLASSLRGSLLLAPQNTDPFTLLNMRSLSPSGGSSEWSVSSRGPKRAGQRGSRAWWSAWEEGMNALTSGEGVGEGLFAVYGHWAGQGLKIQKHSIGLDTGCVYGRQLSALVVPLSDEDKSSFSPLSRTGTTSTSSTPNDQDSDPAAGTPAGAFRPVEDKNSTLPAALAASKTNDLASDSRHGQKKGKGKANTAKGKANTAKGKGKNRGGRTSVSLASATASAGPTGTFAGNGGGSTVKETPLASTSTSTSASASAPAAEAEELLLAPSSSSTPTPGESSSKPWWRPWSRRTTSSSSSSNSNRSKLRRSVQFAGKRAPPQYRPNGGASMIDAAASASGVEGVGEGEGDRQTLGRSSSWWGSASEEEEEVEVEVEVDSSAAEDDWAGAQVDDDLDGVEAALLRTDDGDGDASERPEQDSSNAAEAEGDLPHDEDDALRFAERAVVLGAAGGKRAWVVSADCADEVDYE
ncbi:hypothetical protein JCM1841_005374 [Sporobolomyces salmonicolor]